MSDSTRLRVFWAILFVQIPLAVIALLTATTISTGVVLLIGWTATMLMTCLVIDWLIVRPLRQLHRAVADHGPGVPFVMPPQHISAREIEDLAAMFAQFNRQIGDHDVAMGTALADQTKATREVHHRVKNNLQVIASLISLHARGATSADATAAYSAIQRRVDALSIVHRNHFAELGTADGIDVKGLLSELAASLRAGVNPDVAPALSVDAPRFGIGQDIAVTIAFLVTELVELSMMVDPQAAIAIMIGQSDDQSTATLTVQSSALTATASMAARLSGRYARALEGFSRQLRAPLTHNSSAGAFTIEFALRRPVRKA